MTIIREPKGIKIDPLFSDYLEHKESEFEWLIQPARQSLQIEFNDQRILVKEQRPLLTRSLSSIRKPLPIKYKDESETSQSRQLKQLSKTVNKMAEDLYGQQKE